ncbi:SDR family oxidoreductase [Candidatus Pacearchaeota archaeon]|nr:SDR family oxidoreductase [Candidatus Pacearchaeota archaeon]MBD3283380.1 SDR family oxidoreductase [Candidatus Pacearchaeota archaeon]
MKTAIITGASRGIGLAIAEEFARLRYTLGLISRNQEEVERVLEELKTRYSVDGYAIECDVSNKDRVLSAFERFHQKSGSLDILVNNAGINSRRTLPVKSPEKWFEGFENNLSGWREELDVNLTGSFICSYVAAGYMIPQSSGSIINISSVKAREPTSSPGYGASKAGIEKLTIDLAKSLAPFIRVNCIAPGFIDTGMTAELPSEKKFSYMEEIPQQRFGTVQEVAKTAAFLASSDSSYITGAVIPVNGGYFMTQ